MRRIFFGSQIVKPPPDPTLLNLKCESDTTPETRPGPGPEPYGTTRFAIVTIPRPDVHTTLASLLISGVQEDVHLVVGRPDSSYLDNYKHHRRIKIIEMNTEDWEKMKEQPTGWLACYNYWRALNICNDNLVIMEDDVVFHDGWYEKAKQLVEIIERQDNYWDYGLSMYSQTLITTRTTRPHAKFPLSRFAGMQCFYYPNRIVPRLRDFFRDCLVMPHIRDQLQPDVVVGKWYEDHGLPIFTPKYSLAQHVGTTSSLNSTWHQSPSFASSGYSYTVTE